MLLVLSSEDSCLRYTLWNIRVGTEIEAQGNKLSKWELIRQVDGSGRLAAEQQEHTICE